MGAKESSQDKSGSVGGRRNACGSDVTAGNSVASTSISQAGNRVQDTKNRDRFAKHQFRGEQWPNKPFK